jgi:hypothetical protein
MTSRSVVTTFVYLDFDLSFVVKPTEPIPGIWKKQEGIMQATEAGLHMGMKMC